MITSNHPKAKYKNNGLVNGARGQVDSVQMSKDDPNVVEVVWVRFCDNKVGQLLRNDSKHLLEQHKPNDPFAVPILRQKKQFHLSMHVYSLKRTSHSIHLRAQAYHSN